MGGIKYHHVNELKTLGAKRIAVVTALCQAEDITRETERWVKAITED
jgi:thiamine monophosphate synthase